MTSVMKRECSPDDRDLQTAPTPGPLLPLHNRHRCDTALLVKPLGCESAKMSYRVGRDENLDER